MREDLKRYDIVFKEFTSQGDVVDGSERDAVLKVSEMTYLLKMIEYSIPAMHGWHAMYNSSVVGPAGKPVRNGFDD